MYIYIYIWGLRDMHVYMYGWPAIWTMAVALQMTCHGSVNTYAYIPMHCALSG